MVVEAAKTAPTLSGAVFSRNLMDHGSPTKSIPLQFQRCVQRVVQNLRKQLTQQHLDGFNLKYSFGSLQTDSNNEFKLFTCDGGVTNTPTSSFKNCADCKSRITRIKTAEGGMEMETSHVCMKDYYVPTQCRNSPDYNQGFYMPKAENLCTGRAPTKQWAGAAPFPPTSPRAG